MATEREVAQGMAIRSGIAPVEHAAGKPLPPAEELQLDKMHLVGYLPHAEVLAGIKMAVGLGCAGMALRPPPRLALP